MHYLYHAVPTEMVGETLYPLNILKERHPSVYEKEVKKYAGREIVMQKFVPILECLWNDVLHFSAVHPADIKGALIEAGFADAPTRNFYQVDPRMISPEQAVVYLYSTPSVGANLQDFVKYDPMLLSGMSSVPAGTRTYYQEMHKKGVRPLRYHLVPHVLYKGSLDVSRLPVISV